MLGFVGTRLRNGPEDNEELGKVFGILRCGLARRMQAVLPPSSQFLSTWVTGQGFRLHPLEALLFALKAADLAVPVSEQAAFGLAPYLMI